MVAVIDLTRNRRTVSKRIWSGKALPDFRRPQGAGFFVGAGVGARPTSLEKAIGADNLSLTEDFIR
jgi:hypothetical protein